MPSRIPDEVWHQFDVLHGQRGYSIARAAKAVGVGETAAYEHVKGQKRDGKYYKERKQTDEIPEPLPFDKLSATAKRAVEDFGFFRKHYLGRDTKPWQEIAARRLLEAEQSPDDEYIVMNEPPGSGKSTSFTLDYPLWRLCGNRRLRIQIGSRTSRQAKDYVASIRRSLERTYVMEGAKGCIVRDFGRFKPDNAELWRADEFIVAQLDGQSIEDREPNVRAISQEAAFLGFRAELVIWDDLVDESNTGNPDMREKLEHFWITYAETRLEPGGLLLLQGQRIAPEDLYHFALEMRVGGYEDFDWDELDADELAELPRKYSHVVFPAHDEERCTGDHGKVVKEGGRRKVIAPKPWPDGCLLDPQRLPWRKLASLRFNNRRLFEVSYQQKDSAAGQFLVDERWLQGGEDPETGETYLGCYDRRWDGGNPPVTVGRNISAMTVDPSPTKFWAIQRWLHNEDTDQRFLLDAIRRRMGANEFLDRLQDGTYVGVAEDWVQKAKAQGRPISHLIVEKNAAQRFMLQYEFFQTWLRKNGITLVPHETMANKADPEYGVQTLGSLYRQGKVTLPWSAPWGRKISQPLVDELLRWPEGSTDDCVMAQWFFEYNLRRLRFQHKKRVKAKRPTWLGSSRPLLTARDAA